MHHHPTKRHGSDHSTAPSENIKVVSMHLSKCRLEFIRSAQRLTSVVSFEREPLAKILRRIEWEAVVAVTNRDYHSETPDGSVA